ncbi:MAG: hypothetical protein OCD00_15525 [Colwellia sp.]
MKYSIITLLLLSSCLSAEPSKQKFSSLDICKAFKAKENVIQRQLPTPIDYMTDLIGIYSQEVGHVCLINFMWRIDTNDLIKDMVKENELNAVENLKFIQSDEGHGILKEIFIEMVNNASRQNESIKVLKSFENIKVIFHIKFDDNSIEPLKIMHLNTTNN